MNFNTKEVYINNEIWKAITGFEGIYEVNTFGEIRSLTRIVLVNGNNRLLKEKLLSVRIGRDGYKSVRLSKDGKTYTKYVHRLISEAFVENPFNKTFVNHINGNKLDNRIENLEWVTHSENIKHSYNVGLSHINNHRGVIDLCTGKEFFSIKEASLFYSLNYSTCRNRLRRHSRNKFSLRYKI